MDDKYQVCLMVPESDDGRLYQGSFVFRELIFLLRSALTSLGADCIIKPNQLAEDRINIIIGYHLLKHGDYLARYRYIPYQLEQLAADDGWYPENARLILANAEAVWDYSRKNIAFLADKEIEARFLPIGYHEDLEIIEHKQEKDIDVLFYGSINARRQAVLDQLGRIPGARVATATGVFGSERDDLIARARIVLNMHYYETAILEQPRISYLLNNSCFVISEESADDPYAGLPLTTAPYAELADLCRHFLEHPAEMESSRLTAAEEFRTRYKMSELLQEIL